jgi:alginate O-acetyltransferase complex protein AlgI
VLFNSLVFVFAFLPITYTVFWLLRGKQSRYVWLTITGYVFYGWWDWRFCGLMAFSTLVSYTAGRLMERASTAHQRKLCLVVPVVADLSLLGFFKYANFTLDTVHGIAGLFGYRLAVPHLNIVLPIGISFYTFHTISYIVDSYRRTITPTRNLFEFAAYVSLFSQLIAGPIVRFRQIESDLENLGAADRTRWLGRGLRFFVIGLVEKTIIADSLAPIVDQAWHHVGTLSSLGAWCAVLGYAFQLYFDFDGYSTMAVGLGFLFGLRIPQNFNSPYKATDPSDFWRRWHISLSTCLRDYLYIPLGGNRHGEVDTYRNLMLTMLIGGLWHGANWTFVIWGAYHGVLLAGYRRYGRYWDPLPAAVRRAAMFALVTLGWIVFRAPSMGSAVAMTGLLVRPAGGFVPDHLGGFAIVLAVAAWWGCFGPNAFDLDARLETWQPRPRFAYAYAYALAAAFGAALAVIATTGSSPFLYFQF